MTDDLEARARETLADVCRTPGSYITTGMLATALLRDGERVAELSAALERLARAGTPLARKGAPVCRRQFGRTRFVRPWEWRAV